MLSKYFSRKHCETLNDLCRQYVHSIACALRINACLRRDENWFLNGFSSNTIDEELFLTLINRGSSILGGWRFVKLIVDVVDDSCITDAVFAKLLMINKMDVRNQICIALSHKHLSESKLKALCKLQLCHECFYELVCLCYTDTHISNESFVGAINLFLESKFWEDYVYLLKELAELDASDKTKEDCLKQIIQLSNNRFILRGARLYLGKSCKDE